VAYQLFENDCTPWSSSCNVSLLTFKMKHIKNCDGRTQHMVLYLGCSL